MATIKLTPFLLFLLLLIVLVISVIIGNKYSREGFINFQNDKSPINEVWVPQYSKTKNVTKIYDNIFYDTTNGNLIELDASGLTGGVRRENDTDSSGSTINNILVTPRDAKFTFIYRTDLSNGKVISNNTDAGLKSTLDKSFTSWSYPSQCENTDKSFTFYIPWSDSTYITTIQKAANKVNGVATLFGPGNTISNINFVDISSVTSYIDYNDGNDGNNRKSIIDSMYDASRNVYQLSKYVKYDTLNSNLIIQSGDGANKKLTVYDRYRTRTTMDTVPAPNTTKTSTVPNVGFNSWNVLDACGQNLVLYSCVGVKTVVALACYKDNTMSNIVLRTVVRFNNKNIVVSDEPAESTPSTTPSATTSNAPPPAAQSTTSSPPRTSSDSSDDNSNCPISKYFNWKDKYNCNNSETEFDDRYILKSQIVPPVCPSCPACASCAASSSQTCTNCGGSGGSGTLTTDGKSVVDNKDTRTNLAGAISNIGTGATNVAGNVVDKAGNIIDKAGNIISGAGTGAASLLRDTGSGATGLLRDTASGATGLLKETASEANKLLREAGRGVKDVLKDNDNDRYRYRYDDNRYRNNGTVPMILGTQNQYADQYSYYGTLPEKEDSSYMPITADFSSFRR